MPTAPLAILAAAALLALGACGRDAVPEAPPATTASPASAPATERVVGPLTPADAEALAVMNQRLQEYAALQLTIAASLPGRSTESTPDQIHEYQLAFEQRLREKRADAKAGDIFTPTARPIIVGLLATIFEGPDGAQLKSSIMDENPVDPMALNLTVNGRYPVEVPLATMPPQVLQTLPALGEGLEYRFIGDWLILLDTHAYLIADFIDNALPR